MMMMIANEAASLRETQIRLGAPEGGDGVRVALLLQAIQRVGDGVNACIVAVTRQANRPEHWMQRCRVCRQRQRR